LKPQPAFGVDERTEFKILRSYAGVRKRTRLLEATVMPACNPPADVSREEYIESLCNGPLARIRRNRLAQFAGIRCDPDVYSRRQADRYLTAAKELGFVPTIQAIADAGAAGIGVRIGAASVQHMNSIGSVEADLLASSNTVAVLMPAAVFLGAAGPYPPARTLIDMGAAVALASGYHPPHNLSHSMKTAIALACRAMGMTVAEAISAATINAAHALRIADRTGSLEYGKQADIVILGISDYRDLGQQLGDAPVDLAMKMGRVVYRRSVAQWPDSGSF